MTELHDLKNLSRQRPSKKRVGRGPGSGIGKTCGRGQKGAGARSGYKTRPSYEGGQFRQFMKFPTRGFSNARFRKKLDTINLGEIEKMYQDGETVNLDSLRRKGYLSGTSHGLKILGDGDLTKKVEIQADSISGSALEKLNNAKISFTLNQKS